MRYFRRSKFDTVSALPVRFERSDDTAIPRSTSLPIMASSATRRTRIVCISDTHNCTVKLPEGDVLIHAGDMTNQGSYSEVRQSCAPYHYTCRHANAYWGQLSRAVKWLEEAKFEAKIVIAGTFGLLPFSRASVPIPKRVYREP
jgi:hypothetical protein